FVPLQPPCLSPLSLHDALPIFLTVAVVTKPFQFEGGKRMSVAESGLKELEESVDSLITIPNEKLLAVMGKKTSLLDAFAAANDRSEEHTSELQSRENLVCRLLL